MSNPVLFLLLLAGLSVGCGEQLRVHFIDVGYGDSILIEFPGGKNMLIDGGDSRAGIKVANYLKRKGIKNIDTVVATHPHPDHIDGLLKIIGEFKVDIVLANDNVAENIHYKPLFEVTKEFKQVKKGDIINTFVEILHPETLTGNLNSDSLVLMLKYKNVRFLFTADICQATSDDLAGYYGEKLKSDILQIPHHGQSGSEALFQMVLPDIAVKSIGDSRWRGTLREKKILEILNELNITVLSTDIEGTIVLTTDGVKIWR